VRSFWRFGYDEIETSLNPGLEVPSRPVTFRSYVKEPSHWTTGEIHGPRVGLRERFFVFFRPSANNQVIANDSTAHVPVHHERESAEHALLVYAVDPAQECSDSYRYRFVKGHSTLVSIARDSPSPSRKRYLIVAASINHPAPGLPVYEDRPKVDLDDRAINATGSVCLPLPHPQDDGLEPAPSVCNPCPEGKLL
jgi:hypothetical protein